MTTIYEYIDRKIAENAKYLRNELNLEPIEIWMVTDENGNEIEIYKDGETAKEESRNLLHGLTSEEIRELERKGTIENIGAIQVYLDESQIEDILDNREPASEWIYDYIYGQMDQYALSVYSAYRAERAEYEERAHRIDAYATEIAERDLDDVEYPDCTVEDRAKQISTEVGRALAGSLVDLWVLAEEFEGYLRF